MVLSEGLLLPNCSLPNLVLKKQPLWSEAEFSSLPVLICRCKSKGWGLLQCDIYMPAAACLWQLQ